ncbi:MAG: CoA transferase, partial [Candidatus Methanofastidiosa archaeon]|nr:CoA transferase [Candidatus Methanofastidiosa archaeon]
WLVLLEKAGIPSGPIYTIDRLLNDPQVKHRKMIEEVKNPLYGTIKIPGLPVKLSETRGAIKLSPPVLGEHSEEILKNLGYSEEQIKSMREKGII